MSISSTLFMSWMHKELMLRSMRRILLSGLIAKWLLGCNILIVPEYRSSDMHVL